MIHNLIEKLKIYCHTDLTDLTDSMVVDGTAIAVSLCCMWFFMLLFHLQPSHRTWIRGIFYDVCYCRKPDESLLS